MKRYESRFPASIDIAQSPPQPATLLHRLIEYNNTISRIVDHCVGKEDRYFERYVDSFGGLRVPCTQYLTVAGNGPIR